MVSHNPAAQTPRDDTTDAAESSSDNGNETETESAGPPSALEDLPPICEVVCLILANAEDPLTQTQITDRSARPRKTIQHGVNQLLDETDLVARRPTSDARVFDYTLKRYISNQSHEQ